MLRLCWCLTCLGPPVVSRTWANKMYINDLLRVNATVNVGHDSVFWDFLNVVPFSARSVCPRSGLCYRCLVTGICPRSGLCYRWLVTGICPRSGQCYRCLLSSLCVCDWCLISVARCRCKSQCMCDLVCVSVSVGWAGSSCNGADILTINLSMCSEKDFLNKIHSFIVSF